MVVALRPRRRIKLTSGVAAVSVKSCRCGGIFLRIIPFEAVQAEDDKGHGEESIQNEMGIGHLKAWMCLEA